MTEAQPASPPLERPERRAPRSLVELRPGALATVGELVYLRVFTIAVWGIALASALAMIAAVARTREADFARTAVLAIALILLAWALGRDPDRSYRAMRRRPLLALAPTAFALVCLCLDGVNHSPLSFPSAVTVGVAAYACGIRWGAAAAALLAAGVLLAAAASGGPPWQLEGAGDLASVAPGAAGYFLYAILIGTLGDRFVQLILRMRRMTAPPAAPAYVPNLSLQNAHDARPSASETTSIRPERDTPVPSFTHARNGRLGSLTARQLQVVYLLAEGLRAAEIAERLGVTPKTVYSYVHQAAKRAGATNRNELVALAVKDGLIAPQSMRSV